MKRPLLSVVIPTRNRAETLQHALATCAALGEHDVEIVVSDNAGAPATKAVVEGLRLPNLVYLRHDEALSMSVNWSRAILAATGEYVTVIGDDDGMMPYALRELRRIVEAHERPRLVSWPRAWWTWEEFEPVEDGSVLRIGLGRKLRTLSGREAVRRAINFEEHYHELPMIYNAAVRRDVLDPVRALGDGLLPAANPDMYSGLLLAALAGEYLHCALPMTLAGTSRFSTGHAFSQQERGTRSSVAEDFAATSGTGGVAFHHLTPGIFTLGHGIIDAFEHLRDVLGDRLPGAVEGLDYQQERALTRYLEEIAPKSPADFADSVGRLRRFYADRPDLLSRIDAESRNEPQDRVTYADGIGFDGSALTMSTAGLGVHTIADAVTFASRILGVTERPVDYDIPDLRESRRRAELAEREVELLTARLRLAERDLVG